MKTMPTNLKSYLLRSLENVLIFTKRYLGEYEMTH